MKNNQKLTSLSKKLAVIKLTGKSLLYKRAGKVKIKHDTDINKDIIFICNDVFRTNEINTGKNIVKSKYNVIAVMVLSPCWACPME